MKQSLLSTGIWLAMPALFLFSCRKSMHEENVKGTLSANQVIVLPSPTYSQLADQLESRLKNYVVGYSIVISYKDTAVVNRAGGRARTFTDFPLRDMSVNEKYSVASVSKTISAAALLKALADADVSVDDDIVPFLPEHWSKGEFISFITFRDLLNHTSGFHYKVKGDANKCSYADLKQLIAEGIALGNTSRSYDNRNYALMRLLIPRLAQYSITKWLKAYPSWMLPSVEGIQEKEYANAYIDYCRKVVFSKMSSTANVVISCKNTDANPGLYYPDPGVYAFGNIVSDLTLVSGGQGWVLNTTQMADFMRTLHHTEKILPKSISATMSSQLLGYDEYGGIEGVAYWWKNGGYESNGRKYSSLIMGFGDGIQIAIMTNSHKDLAVDALNAYKAWHQ
jgi:hypothetical protein